jgi:ABC-type Mn2+/Zn2+ transport system permease subunit
MISGFLQSWDLFGATYLTGWAIAALLGLLGVLIVARDQIFLGAAVTEASTLGVALAMWVGSVWGSLLPHWHENDLTYRFMAVLFSVAATMATARAGGTGRETHEAVTGWIFLVSSAGSILLVSHSPHGLEEIHRLLSSSIIGATAKDAWVFGILFVLAAAGIAAGRRPLLMTLLDPQTAAAIGVRTRLWTYGSAAAVGLAIGLSLRVSGTLYTFGCLVLPALAARSFCRELGPMFLAAPAIGLACSIPGFVLAHEGDFPPGQMTVALMCLALLGAWLVRFARRRLSRA